MKEIIWIEEASEITEEQWIFLASPSRAALWALMRERIKSTPLPKETPE